jgi:integrase/recombinase XerD
MGVFDTGGPYMARQIDCRRDALQDLRGKNIFQPCISLVRMYILNMKETALTVSRTLAPVAPGRPDEHPVAVYLARLGLGSRRAMAQALRVVASVLKPNVDVLAFPWSALRYQHTAAVRAILAERYAPAAANKVLSALRGVLMECFRLGLMSAEDHARASDIPNVKGSSPQRGRALKPGELSALFAACDATTAQGARDAALLAVLFGAGLRRAEAVSLDLSDLGEDGALVVRNGKGRKSRTVYLVNGARDAVAAWLDVRGNAPGPLFLAVGKDGNVRPGRITPGAVYLILGRVREDARVKPFSPHDARRSYVTSLLAGGAPITVVQALAGHASVATTARYDRSGEDAKRRAAETLHVPFAG